MYIAIASATLPAIEETYFPRGMDIACSDAKNAAIVCHWRLEQLIAAVEKVRIYKKKSVWQLGKEMVLV